MHDNQASALAILVVEDEWMLREALASHLRSAGCHVLEASCGEAALGVLRNGNGAIDVVVTDIRLGGEINGWDVGEAACARGGIRVIYVSGHASMPTRQVNGSVFFDKPYDVDAVLAACQPLDVRTRN